MPKSKFTTHVETWNERVQERDEHGRFTSNGKVRRRGRVVVRDQAGRLHGATNLKLTSKVGQVATQRRG